MNTRKTRECPICGGSAGDKAFPYSARFNEVDFDYLQCKGCGCTFVDPVPDAATFARMYAKENYHDVHYSDVPQTHYETSAGLLAKFLPDGAKVIDYGCGTGDFLKALKGEGFLPTGVEFDQDAANFAGKSVGCPAFSVADFLTAPHSGTFDALHLGDALEHMPHPAETLRELLKFVKPGGLLFVEGPLENNSSPVFWAARAFGAIKRFVEPNFIRRATPTHLLRVNAQQQSAFFSSNTPGLTQLHWEVYENGWPYASGGRIKRAIAVAANALGGKEFGRTTFGNRFLAVFQIPGKI